MTIFVQAGWVYNLNHGGLETVMEEAGIRRRGAGLSLRLHFK